MREFDIDEIMIKNTLEQNSPNPSNLTDDELSIILKPRRRQISKRARIASIVAAIILIPTITVAAAVYSSYSKLLEDVGPELSEYLEQVETACESDGIRMELVGYYYDGTHLKAYINLEDTEGLGRVTDKIMDHMDFFAVKESGDYGWSIANYDEEAGIITYELDVTLIDNDELAVRIKDLYYEPVDYNELDTCIDIEEMCNKTPTLYEGDIISVIGTSSKSTYEEVCERFSLSEASDDVEGCWSGGRVLTPGVLDISVSDISYFKITNIGYVDGFLHVQTWVDLTDSASICSFYLQDNEGNKLEAYCDFGYTHESGEHWEEGNCYWEYIFDIDESELSNYKLLTDCETSPVLEGRWEITIPIVNNDTATKAIATSFSLDDFKVNRTELTAFNLTLYGGYLENTDTDFTKQTATIHLEDRDVVLEFREWSNYNENGPIQKVDSINESYIKWTSESPIDVDNVKSITIGDQTIDFSIID